MASKLKPCPCGGTAHIIPTWDTRHKTQYYVRCEDCDRRTGEYHDEAAAIDRWNRYKGKHDGN